MKMNMGLIDRIFRAIVAIIIAILYFTDQITGTMAAVLGTIALVFLITSFIGFCPLYKPLGFSTKKK